MVYDTTTYLGSYWSPSAATFNSPVQLPILGAALWRAGGLSGLGFYTGVMSATRRPSVDDIVAFSS